MIEILTPKNIDIVNNSFISKDMVESEFKNNPFAKFLVLIENKEIIGYIYYSDIYERAEINQFEINLIHRNCGKGDKLLKKMLELVNKDVTLEVKEDNLAAIKLYTKNGFLKKTIRKGYYQGVDAILMERKTIN